MKRALTRKMSLEQAQSYRREAAPPSGVSAIASVGTQGLGDATYDYFKRAWAERDYARNPEEAVATKRRKKRRKSAAELLGMSEGELNALLRKALKQAQEEEAALARRRKKRARRRYTANEEGAPEVAVAGEAKPKGRRKRGKAKKETEKKAAKKAKAFKIGARRVTGATVCGLEDVKKLVRKAVKKERKKLGKRVLKQLARRKKRLEKVARFFVKPGFCEKQPRLFGSKKKPLYSPRARIGPYTVRPTYVYVTRSGGLAKIPEHAFFGFATRKQLDKAIAQDPDFAARVQEWRTKMKARREKAAKVLAESGGIFVPNEQKSLSFEEWSKMQEKKDYLGNPKKRKRAKASAGKKRKSAKASAGKKRKRVAVKARRRSRFARRGTPRYSVWGRAELYALAPRGRKKGKRGKKGKRSYVPNPTLPQYVGNALDAGKAKVVAKHAAGIAAGTLAYRGVLHLLAKHVETFQKEPNAPLYAGAALAAAGVALGASDLHARSWRFSAGAGLLLSFMLDLGDLLYKKYKEREAKKQAEAAAKKAASGYGDRPGSPYALGSYYEYYPGQPLGELRQAAAGVGEYYTPSYLPGASAVRATTAQAAAGFGEAGLRQAAAGTGEYVVTDAQGIGDYVEVVPEYTQPGLLDEGIAPSLTEAEDALNRAEQAAGVGQNEEIVPIWTTEPIDESMPIGDEPEGERAGVFQGQEGIFAA